MRVAVLSDIHANMAALDAVLAALGSLSADRIVSLGDNVGYGPEPERVMAALAEHGIVSVLGNHERAILDPVHRLKFNPLARKALMINRHLLSERSLSRIRAFPKVLVLEGARFVHGLPPDRIDRYIHKEAPDRLARIMDTLAEALSFVGHTHRTVVYASGPDGITVEKFDRSRVFLAKACRYIINSGSVGQPRDGRKTAVFMIWDTTKRVVEKRTVPYDARRTCELIRACGIPGVYADLLC